MKSIKISEINTLPVDRAIQELQLYRYFLSRNAFLKLVKGRFDIAEFIRIDMQYCPAGQTRHVTATFYPAKRLGNLLAALRARYRRIKGIKRRHLETFLMLKNCQLLNRLQQGGQHGKH